MVHQRKGAPWGIRPVGQAVKTPASHAGNAGSIPARVTNFPHRLTRNRTREGFGRVRKARSGFPAKGAQQLAASRADCKAGCRFPHGSPISLFPTNPTPYPNIRSLAAFDHTAGDYDAEDPPVPIPNTEVKLSRAENTWRVAAWKHRSSPASLYSSIAQSVEHATVNRRVVGSSPTWGARSEQIFCSDFLLELGAGDGVFFLGMKQP